MDLLKLESQTIHWIREVYSQYPRTIMLWSAGKDSTALLWMVRKAFFGKIPFPVVHIDTSFKPKELIQFRDELANQWGFDLRIFSNQDAILGKNTFPDHKLSRMDCCRELKTRPLLNLVKPKVFGDDRVQVVIVGLRSDEEGSRSKERFVSTRNADSLWDPASEPPQMDGYFPPSIPEGYHLRLHPILEWTEVLIWEYTKKENIPINPLYFAKNNRRYRSLGCLPCSGPIESSADSVDKILLEMQSLSLIAERKGRGQDSEDGGGLETLRRGGYM